MLAHHQKPIFPPRHLTPRQAKEKMLPEIPWSIAANLSPVMPAKAGIHDFPAKPKDFDHTSTFVPDTFNGKSAG
jgi:hypothetical protein